MYRVRERVRQTYPGPIKNDPLFESIKDEPQFQYIVSDVEAKYQAENDHVRKWIEAQEKL
jgi:hypothetical protein